MKIEGRIEKSGKWWAVSVPLLLVFSQGKTKKSALLMIKSAVEELVDSKGFKVYCGPLQANTFSISSKQEMKENQELFKESFDTLAKRICYLIEDDYATTKPFRFSK